MRQFILPTGDLFFEFRQYEPLFGFRADGVRGVLRDLVLLPSCPKAREEDFDQLCKDVLDEYDRSVERLYLENMFARRDYASWLVELMLDEADIAVYRMLREIFRGLEYEVDRKDCQWLGIDLLTVIHVR